MGQGWRRVSEAVSTRACGGVTGSEGASVALCAGSKQHGFWRAGQTRPQPSPLPKHISGET